MLCWDWHQLSLPLLLVICHDVHLWNFPLVNFVPTKYDKSFKWQPGKIIMDF